MCTSVGCVYYPLLSGGLTMNLKITSEYETQLRGQCLITARFPFFITMTSPRAMVAQTCNTRHFLPQIK